MDKLKAIEKLNILLEKLNNLPPYQPRSNNEFNKWYRDTEIAIENIFGKETRHINDFKNIHFIPWAITAMTTTQDYASAHNKGIEHARTLLLSLIDEIKEYWIEDDIDVTADDPINKLNIIFNRFNKVARQLKIRYDNRTTLLINDEYDVQDLFISLLQLFFDDIRPEEYTPSYAGGSSRIDFLLNNEKIAIEIKKTRKNLKEKELGEELLIDIQKYQSHPKVKKLFCFIYDPEGLVNNPIGLENDLTRKIDNIEVVTIVTPKF